MYIFVSISQNKLLLSPTFSPYDLHHYQVRSIMNMKGLDVAECKHRRIEVRLVALTNLSILLKNTQYLKSIRET